MEIYLPLRYRPFYTSAVITITCVLLLRTKKTMWDFFLLHYWPVIAISYLVAAVSIYG